MSSIRGAAREDAVSLLSDLGVANPEGHYRFKYVYLLLQDLEMLSRFKDRMENGCRRCGNKQYAELIVDAQVRDPSLGADAILSRENFSLCRACLSYVLSRHFGDELNTITALQARVKRLERKLERQRALRRKRDERNRDRRRERDAKKREPQNDPWMKLAKLDVLAEHGSTESERENAKTRASELRGRLMTSAA